MKTSSDYKSLLINRRKLLGYSAAVGVAAGFRGPLSAWAQESPLGVNADEWTPDYISSIAGTLEVDTAAECAKVVPLDYTGRLTYWWVGPNEASPEIDHEVDKQFWAAFAKTYPNITVENQNLGYNDMLNKLRTAALGHAAPMAARLPILWGVEFAAKGQLQEFAPEDVGYPTSEFWPGAMKSVTWHGKTYGVPTNNETMAFIWNAAIFDEAGLDPEAPPATWDDVVAYSKQIKEKTGKNGYGLVARVNAGNTPFRFMPQCWAYGGGALDEAEANPTYEEVYINNEGSKAALQASYDMYVRDKSVPASALTNTNDENLDPFVAGQLAMMISHPSSYAAMLDAAARATGADKKIADAVVANMRYGLIPRARRARGRVRRLERPHLQPRRRGRRRRRRRRAGARRVLDRARVVDASTTGPAPIPATARLPDQVDEGAARADQVPRRHDVDAAVRHPVPGDAGIDRDHEHHRAGDDAERADREDDGGGRGRRRGGTDRGSPGGAVNPDA